MTASMHTVQPDALSPTSNPGHNAVLPVGASRMSTTRESPSVGASTELTALVMTFDAALRPFDVNVHVVLHSQGTNLCLLDSSD
jgi:hypothetical protein